MHAWDEMGDRSASVGHGGPRPDPKDWFYKINTQSRTNRIFAWRHFRPHYFITHPSVSTSPKSKIHFDIEGGHYARPLDG